MRKLIPTLTQSGLLAVLLQRQRYKVVQLAWRCAQRKHMRTAVWSTLTWPWRALTAPMPIRHSRRDLRRIPPAPRLNLLPRPIAMSPPIHTYTELQQQIHDDLRIQHPDWVQSNGKSPKRIQRIDRSSSSRARTGSDWKLKTYGICFKAS